MRQLNVWVNGALFGGLLTAIVVPLVAQSANTRDVEPLAKIKNTCSASVDSDGTVFHSKNLSSNGVTRLGAGAYVVECKKSIVKCNLQEGERNLVGN